MKHWGHFLAVALVLIGFAPACAAEQKGLSDREIWLLYKELREVRSFGIVAVSTVGDTGKIGLNQSELTSYAKLKFRQHFRDTKLEDLERDSKRFLEFIASREKRVGNITIRVWVIGEDYPVVYHIKCDAGNFDNPSIWTEEILGHGSKQTAPEAIKAIIDEMMENFALIFHKIKGQQTRYNPNATSPLL